MGGKPAVEQGDSRSGTGSEKPEVVVGYRSLTLPNVLIFEQHGLAHGQGNRAIGGSSGQAYRLQERVLQNSMMVQVCGVCTWLDSSVKKVKSEKANCLE